MISRGAMEDDVMLQCLCCDQVGVVEVSHDGVPSRGLNTLGMLLPTDEAGDMVSFGDEKFKDIPKLPSDLSNMTITG